MAPRFYTFWAINGPLDQARLRRQLEQFRVAGLDGVVWHPRFYPNDPPYLSDRYLAEVSEVILNAKSLGLAFWIYDENGWPSGTVGGQLLKKHPDDAQRWAELVTEKPKHCLAEFEHDGEKWFLAGRIGRGVDYFSPDFTRHFLELTHERYRTGLKPEAWQHVEAIFCDEPEFGLGHAFDSLSKHGAIPWTPQLLELFHLRYGEELLPLIPKILLPGNDVAEARINFWELLTDVFNESFTAPIYEWCQRHGKRFTAHLKGEEHPLFQVPTNGSCHQFFRNLSLPAIDALERYPANNFYPRQVSSAARQFGNGRCMVEVFGGAGWGAMPEDLERSLLWLGRNGLTDFVLHLSQYRLDSVAMQDWPPSQPLHLTWRAAYPEVLRRVRHALENQPRSSADTLVIAPNRGIMANYQPQEFLQTNVHNAATYPDSTAGKINRRFMQHVEALHNAGVNYDIADERTVEQFCRTEGGVLALGICRYRHVVLDAGCRLNEATRALMQSLVIGTPASGPVPTRRNQERAGPAAGAPSLDRWELERHPNNLWLLECTVEADGWVATTFRNRVPLADAMLELVFADDIAEAALNRMELKLEASDEGSRAKVSDGILHASNQLRFRAKHPVERPFAWLQGRFRVMSGSPFTAGPNQTVKTDGPFTLHPAGEAIQYDLIADGFPFLRESVLLAGNVTLVAAASAIQFGDMEADAVRLWVDGLDQGWSWRNNGEVRFDLKLAAGNHRLRLELVPNTYNAFGPHHYYGGDWPVVSPDQFQGVRNFADPADAPASTHVKAWHFRRFQVPRQICFLS